LLGSVCIFRVVAGYFVLSSFLWVLVLVRLKIAYPEVNQMNQFGNSPIIPRTRGITRIGFPQIELREAVVANAVDYFFFGF
jgi:hypothetical protein